MASDARSERYDGARPAAVAFAEDDRGTLAPGDDRDAFARERPFDQLTEPSLVIDPDDRDYAADPAASVVSVGEVPEVPDPVNPRRRLVPPMPTDAARGWIVTVVLTLIGGMLRFWELGWRTDGGTPLFDEKYYAVQAAEMLRTGGVEDNQAFGVIVHPPLGKQLIAIGELLFGYTPTGWRLASAIAGTLAILIVIRAVRRLTRSTMLGGIAGILLICDGLSQVMAHTALLDSIQAPFVIGAFACLLADRDLVRRRFAAATASGTMLDFPGGLPLGARWWRFAAGFLLGCATAIKWNGAYWIVAFGIMTVIWDISARREYGLRNPVSAVFRRDLLPSLWSLGVVPVLTYLGSYWAWFLNETGWDRHVTAGGDGIVGALRSLVTMTVAMLQTTDGILTPTDPQARHPWESKPWAWPLSARPVLYYLAGGEGTTGCGDGRTDCVKRILAVGTPMLWWVSLFVLGWALWKAFARLDWRYAAVLVGYGAGYLPWFLIFDRQMYSFYMTPVAPFLVIGITLVLGDILGRAAPARVPRRRARVPISAAGENDAAPGDSRVAADDPTAGGGPADGTRRSWLPRVWARMRCWDGRTVRLVIVCGYVGLVAANFIWMWPILMGNPITPEHLRWETWLPSWG
jgi:dolichyl-phosphate-mannose--protein O-mannosyl transferase